VSVCRTVIGFKPDGTEPMLLMLLLLSDVMARVVIWPDRARQTRGSLPASWFIPARGAYRTRRGAGYSARH
jgi:hypothetical protein